MNRALGDILANALVAGSISCGLASPALPFLVAGAQALPAAGGAFASAAGGGAMAIAAAANADALAAAVFSGFNGAILSADAGGSKDPIRGVPQ